MLRNTSKRFSIPVLTPTMEEMADFSAYIEKVAGVFAEVCRNPYLFHQRAVLRQSLPWHRPAS
jgi:hypothetical protein